MMGAGQHQVQGPYSCGAHLGAAPCIHSACWPACTVRDKQRVCLPYIREYAADQDKFFKDFAAAYVKLATLGAVWR